MGRLNFSIDSSTLASKGLKLSFLVNKQAEALNLEFHYDSNLFDVESIERIAEQFESVSRKCSKNPEAIISELKF